MSQIFSYRDNEIYSHHSITLHPETEGFNLHAHEWLEILYCISGKGHYQVEGVQYPLQPGDIFILRPGEMHKIAIDPDTAYERIVIHFSPDILKPLDPELTLLRPFLDRPLGRYNRFSADSDPDRILRSAFSGFSFDHIANPRMNLTARLLLLLSSLNGLYKQEETHIPAQGLQSQLVDYVNEHLFENISIQSIADEFYRSRSQISRVFQQATGSSLWEYITIKRLMAARAMMQRGKSASEAASSCGFSEYSSFYRSYKSHFGHSPKEDCIKQP